MNWDSILPTALSVLVTFMAALAQGPAQPAPRRRAYPRPRPSGTSSSSSHSDAFTDTERVTATFEQTVPLKPK